MKKLLFILLIISSFQIHAQEELWKKYGVDSLGFVEIFGSIDQYKYQKGIEQKSSHKTLCVWIGSRPQWLYNFATYLGKNNYNVEWDENSNTHIVIRATPKTYNSAKPPVIKLIAPYTVDYVTKSATITGPADDVIKIFIGYWELSGLSMNELKTKKAVTKEFVSDKVSLTWSGSAPIIQVTKNTSAAMDMFPLN
jgi:hypothetical protein